MILDKCIRNTAEKISTDKKTQSDIKADLLLLYSAIKLLIPVLMIILLGFSLSLISILLQVVLMYYFYGQVVAFYGLLRNHTHLNNNITGNPETDIQTLLMELGREIIDRVTQIKNH